MLRNMARRSVILALALAAFVAVGVHLPQSAMAEEASGPSIQKTNTPWG